MELIAKDLGRRYFRQGKGKNFFFAVEQANLILEPGTLIQISGRSGSGKSTLLNMLAGLLEPTTGQVLLGSQDFYALSDPERSRLRNRSIGVIPQGHTGLHSLTVLENVKLPTRLYGEKTCTDEQAADLLELVGIGDLKDVYPNELSGGEMRRLAIARALVMDPEILLADEPTGDLDDQNTQRVLSLLRAKANEGKAVLLVTHEKEAAAYCDQVYQMSGGVLTPAK